MCALHADWLSVEFASDKDGETDVFHWICWIAPTGGMYEGLRFEVHVKLPSDYPFKVTHTDTAHTKGDAPRAQLHSRRTIPTMSLGPMLLSLTGFVVRCVLMLFSLCVSLPARRSCLPCLTPLGARARGWADAAATASGHPRRPS